MEPSFEAGPWRIWVTKSHILRSKCERALTSGCPRDSKDRCNVCRFGQDVDLPLPEMVFPESNLKLEHESGVMLEFLTMDALKQVNSSEHPLKVAGAEQWTRQRTEGLQKVKESVKPFDWTYTTNYRGTLSSTKDVSFEVTETEERIDYERLKKQENIAFYEEVILFEDELADNGEAILSVKIRVMPSGFFILLRYFLRVDGVLLRLNDTRYYHQAGANYLLREYTSKDTKLSEMRVPPSFITDPNKLSELLPTRELSIHKLTLPSDSTHPTPSN